MSKSIKDEIKTSYGGIDVLISSKYVGTTGKVYGRDMTDEMLELANKNKEKIGAKNVEFIKGYIEDIPMKDESIQMWVGCISGALTVTEYERILNDLGFKDIKITIANIYTKSFIKEIAESKDLGELYSKMDEDAIDGAFAGAYVKAYK